MKFATKCLLLLLPALLGASGNGRAIDAMPPGSLKAYTVAVENPRYLERWAAAPPQELQSKTRFEPGGTAYVAVIVTGYRRNQMGQIDLEADFRFYDNRGKVIFRRDAYTRAQKFVASEDGFILLAPTLDIDFDPQDLPGDYRILFDVRDKLNGHRTRSETTLTLAPPD